MDEHRKTHRIHFDCLVDFEANEICHVCELLDISLQGALIAGCSGATPSAGTACKLTISLDDEKNQQIIMEGHIAHKIENRVGIRCEHIDLDSITHLRHLLEYNLGDPSLIERELSALQHEH